MRNRKTLFASLVIALFLCTLPQAFAKVWYVKTTGNNANSGATEALAKASIQEMIKSTSVLAGDTILVWGGTYTEQIMTGNLDVTIIGSQGGSRTIIQAPDWASMTSYTFVDQMNWNGAGRLSSNKLRPIVFANASSSIINTNIRGIDIDGSTANMPEGETDVFAGLAYRQSQGLIGGVGDSTYVEVRNIKQSGSNSNALNNTVGVLFIERAKPTMKNTRVKSYRNIGIASIGNNTSALQTVQDHQPSPIIENCVVTGEDGGTSSTSADAIQAGLVVVNGARVNISKSHISGNRSGNAAGDRIAYGVYMWNARNSTIGHATTKANGNVIDDNEIGLYVRVTVSSLAATMYSVKNNNIVYNGGTAAGLGTPSGKVANYGSSTASYTTSGAVRFSHSSNFTQVLNLSDNAWGNSEAFDFFSYSAAGYSLASYQATPVAYWRETNADEITFTNPLKPATTTVMSVSPSHSGSNASGTITVDTDFGYTDFDQLNRAVFAAGYNSGAANLDPKINLNGNTVENGSVIITKPVKVTGSGSTCDAYPSITLRSGLNEPTVWVYGLSAGDGDVTNRAPIRDTLTKVRILANNTQTSGNASSGPAVLITGSTTGTNSPVKAVFSYMSISNEFDGTTGPQAYSTSQSGTSVLTRRYSVLASGPYYALYTRRPEACNTIVGGPNVIDNNDNPVLAKFQFDNIIEVATCTELNNEIINAAGPDFTTLLIVANIGSLATPCVATVNNVQPITVDVQTGSTAFVHYLLNPGASNGGGTNAICSFLRTTPTSGGTHNAVRVTVYPPACLQGAVDLISSGTDNVLVAADGNNGASSSFTDGTVLINKQFDYRGATRATAHLATPTNGDATLTGKFILNSGADISNIGGTLTSTRGTDFGDATNQVDLSFSSTTLTNFGGQAINMSLNLIGTTGSRRLNLTSANYSTETPTINKRVFVSGLASRGTSTGTITLNGSGNCLVGNADASSVLSNLNVATVVVTNLTDCIQTALGRVVDCDNSSQHIEGVGTSAANGSGGTVNLTPNAGSFNQNLEIAKAVTLNEGLNATLGTGTLTLRRGADVSGAASFFADNISMTQCFSTHANGANPSMTQALNLAGTGATSTITVAGYGSTNGVGQGSGARGVWQFSDINVNRDVTIRGNYHNVPSTLLSTDCSLLSQTTLPSVNPARIAGNETVIGGNGSNTYAPTNNRIFRIQDSGADIKGFVFNNVIASGGSAVVVGSGANDNEISNNILTSTNNNSVGLVKNEGGIANSDLDIIDNYVSLSGSSASLSDVINISNMTNTSGQNSVTGNAVSIGLTMGALSRFSNVNNTATNGLQISGNWLSGGTSHVMLMNAGTTGLNGIVVEQNAIRNVSNGIEINNNSIDPGANGLRIRENIFGTVSAGVVISGDFTTVTTNRIFVNNNDLSGTNFNGDGIKIDATTSSAATSANMFDLRFNWWGNVLGPRAGSNVATSPKFAATDSVTSIGFVAFSPAAPASFITDKAGNEGRWSIYPVAVSANDGSATCGWQYATMMGPVLRVDNTRTTLLGMYNKIEDARDNANALATPAASSTRLNTDQIYVHASTSYSGTPFGYSATESTYPVVFNSTLQPSAVRGMNHPQITIASGTGSIQVGSSFPSGFTVENIKHAASVGTFTGISFANAFANTATDNTITSSAASTFTGILTTSNAVTGTHIASDNIIRATNSAATFTGIEYSGAVSGTTASVDRNVISTTPSTGSTKSTGIYILGNNFTSALSTTGNQISTMSAPSGDVSALNSYWGTGIYVSQAAVVANQNNIQGGNSGVGGTLKGHDGITLDRPKTSTTVTSNTISTISNLTGINTSGNRERGYGIKIFSNTGAGAIGDVTISTNTLGTSSSSAPDVASIYVGGTSGAIGTIGITSNTIQNARNTANAAVQIATQQYSGAASSGTINITSNVIGSVTSGLSNAMFLAIGTDGFGTGRSTLADNITTSVTGNSIRTSAQVITSNSREVADARPTAGTNVRNIFRDNTYTHAAILTGEAGLANYSNAMLRTAPAVALGAAATTPVSIERLIQTPLTLATSNEASNTVEIRENRDFSVSTASLYYNEDLTIPDQRILILGPASTLNGFAELLSTGSGTGTLVTANGRENKDIRGGIGFNTGNTVGADWFGRINGGTAASNKGDVYLQLDAVGATDAALAFRTHSPFGTPTAVTGLSNTTARTNIKGGFDDADDDGYTANSSTSRRTGVFRSGTAASQFLKGTPEGIAGSTPLNVFPNPASGDVTVAFTVPFEGMVRVALYNALGEKVTDLREGNLGADSYTTTFSAAGLPSGTYHVRLVHDLYTLTTAVTVIK